MSYFFVTLPYKGLWIFRHYFYLAAECGPCTHGHCSAPGICTCHPGYTGPTCEDCIPNPDCEYGTCINNPFECVCYDGFEGLFCTTPICKESCHPEHVRTHIYHNYRLSQRYVDNIFQKVRPVLKYLRKNLSDGILKLSKIKLKVFLNWISKLSLQNVGALPRPLAHDSTVNMYLAACRRQNFFK